MTHHSGKIALPVEANDWWDRQRALNIETAQFSPIGATGVYGDFKVSETEAAQQWDSLPVDFELNLSTAKLFTFNFFSLDYLALSYQFHSKCAALLVRKLSAHNITLRNLVDWLKIASPITEDLVQFIPDIPDPFHINELQEQSFNVYIPDLWILTPFDGPVKFDSSTQSSLSAEDKKLWNSNLDINLESAAYDQEFSNLKALVPRIFRYGCYNSQLQFESLNKTCNLHVDSQIRFGVDFTYPCVGTNIFGRHMDTSPFSKLNEDICWQIVKHLDVNALLQIFSVNSNWKALGKRYWKIKCQHDGFACIPGQESQLLAQEGINWQQIAANNGSGGLHEPGGAGAAAVQQVRCSVAVRRRHWRRDCGAVPVQAPQVHHNPTRVVTTSLPSASTPPSPRLTVNIGNRQLLSAFRNNFSCIRGRAIAYSFGLPRIVTSHLQLQTSIRCFSESQKEYARSSEDIKIPLRRVIDTEGAVRGAEGTMREAKEAVQKATLRSMKWMDANPEFTGKELKFLKGEVDSASARLDTLTRKFTRILPRPKSVFHDDDIWQKFVISERLESPDSQFFEALLTNRHIEELPIAEPPKDCITTYTDPSTKVQVICLPHPLPRSVMIGSHVIFIRPFNIAMMKTMIACTTGRIVVVGNEGIGKSYIQLVIFLWWMRKELRPQGVEWDDFFDHINVIARLERDTRSTLLLYEPCVSKDEISNCGLTYGHTNTAVKYMECANEDELLFMAKVLEQGLSTSSPLKNLFDGESKRIRTIGSFQRAVLPTSKNALAIENHEHQNALSNLTAENLLKAWNIFEDGSSGAFSINHHILRISPRIDEDKEFETYTLKPSSIQVTEQLGNLLFNTEIMEIKRQLISYNENPDSASISDFY
ncbi:hypothetical protein HK100_001893 [Physocladia obscura]|uniref:F-box domain-containing protein n=1 Tax=Physocladia obscura TaxID=109957 RepID=A0AAD5SY81_9FUNG|nr:hypothetical protein HK100_001893 [Physocladia obscura]